MTKQFTRRKFLAAAGVAALVLTAALAAEGGGIATGAADRDVAKPPGHELSDKTDNGQVIAYYFHRRIRCLSCEEMEQKIREVIEQRFPAALAKKRLLFKTVNYDEPENQVFVKRYKLSGSSLVLTRIKGGKDINWKKLDAILEYTGNSVKFEKYVYSEIDQFLDPKE